MKTLVIIVCVLVVGAIIYHFACKHKEQANTPSNGGGATTGEDKPKPGKQEETVTDNN